MLGNQPRAIGAGSASHWLQNSEHTTSLLNLGKLAQDPCEDGGRNMRKELSLGTSLVVWWLRIHLAMQGTSVPSLVWEEPTRHGATKPVGHNYSASALEPGSCSQHA